MEQNISNLTILKIGRLFVDDDSRHPWWSRSAYSIYDNCACDVSYFGRVDRYHTFYKNCVLLACVI